MFNADLFSHGTAPLLDPWSIRSRSSICLKGGSLQSVKKWPRCEVRTSLRYSPVSLPGDAGDPLSALKYPKAPYWLLRGILGHFQAQHRLASVFVPVTFLGAGCLKGLSPNRCRRKACGNSPLARVVGRPNGGFLRSTGAGRCWSSILLFSGGGHRKKPSKISPFCSESGKKASLSLRAAARRVSPKPDINPKITQVHRGASRNGI